MKRKTTLLSIIILLLAFIIPLGQVFAQDYSFEVTRYDVQAIIEEDGSLTLLYEMDFKNGTGAHVIDFVDLGLPYADYSLDKLTATIDGKPIPKISNSSYVHGAELALGDNQIPAGGFGEVKAKITGIKGVLTPYDQSDRENYVNFQFTPNYFDSNYDRSRNTDYRFSIVLPPAVGAEEGVYYKAERWPGNAEAEATLTTEGQRVIYEWKANNADTHTVYTFGAAFPATAVPASAVSTEPVPPKTVSSPGSGVSGISGIISKFRQGAACVIPVFMFSAFVAISIIGNKANQRFQDKRKMAYLPPTLSVEGHGIKRGLTAVEAGILLEEPLDKVLTMILFGLLKKEAITVVSPDPLKINPANPMPAGLYKYETKFVTAMQMGKTQQRTAIQSMMVDLVRSVEGKMKGFSSTETKAYYQDIVNRAWQAVEQAQTPDVKSAQFDHTLEWTMLDKDFSGRTTRTFTDVPVFLPRWWGRYSPVYSSPMMGGGSAPSGGYSGSGGGVQMPSPSVAGPSPRPSFSLPNLPGSAFAASVIDGGANMAKSVIGDTETFTSGVTSRTNPIPVSSGGGGFSGGGGSSCACACACAGCACACAGGGR